MELKLYIHLPLVFSLILLIVPYGIETALLRLRRVRPQNF